jgi:hypothetical protein
LEHPLRPDLRWFDLATTDALQGSYEQRVFLHEYACFKRICGIPLDYGYFDLSQDRTVVVLIVGEVHSGAGAMLVGREYSFVDEATVHAAAPKARE